MNVHRTKNESNDDIDGIKKEMFSSSFHANDDMTIELKGMLHNNNGFILTVSNMEKLDDKLLTVWKRIVEARGYFCSLQYDFQDGWVDVKCEKTKRRPCIKASHVSLVGYLSLLLFSIYALWYRQNKMPLK